MIYDPVNSLIFFSLIQVVVFLFLHFHSPGLAHDHQDNRNYREIKFIITSFPACCQVETNGWCWTSHAAAAATECRRTVPTCVRACTSVRLPYFVFCADLVWQLTEGWEQRSCRPWSARRNSWDAPRQGEPYLVTPTLPSPCHSRPPLVLPFSCQPVAPSLAVFHIKCWLHLASQIFPSEV